MDSAASMRKVEMPVRARQIVIILISPILSPNGPPNKAPVPKMNEAIVETRAISKMLVLRLVMIKESREGVITNIEWFNA